MGKKLMLCGLLIVGSCALVAFGQVQFGVGLKFFSNAPFGLASVRYGSVGAELSLGFSTSSITLPQGTLSLTALFYTLDAKFYPLKLAEFADLYAGLGGAGVTVSISAAAGGGSASVSATIMGVHVTAGAEARFPPLAIFGGGDWLVFFLPTDWSQGVTFPFGGGTYHLGVRYDF